MKIQNTIIAAMCAVGTIAAPSWAWKDDNSVQQYFRTDGSDVFFCKSGWEAVAHGDPTHGLALAQYSKREAEPTLGLLKKLLEKLLGKLNELLGELSKLKLELSKCKKDWEDWKKKWEDAKNKGDKNEEDKCKKYMDDAWKKYQDKQKECDAKQKECDDAKKEYDAAN